MNNLISSNDNNSISLTNIEETFSTIKKALEHVGLPSEKIFAEPKERLRVFKNLMFFWTIFQMIRLVNPFMYQNS